MRDDDDDFAETALDPIAVNVRLEPEPPVREPAMRDAPQSATPSSVRGPAPEAALAGEPDGASTQVLPWRAREGEGAVDDDAGMTELDRDAFAPFQPPQIRGGWSDGAGVSPERATPRRVPPPRRVPDSDLGLKLALGGLVALIVILVVVIVAGLASTVDDAPAESTTEASE